MWLKLFFYTAGCVILTVPLFSFSFDDLEPWPAAEEGYVRKIIWLDTLDNESDHRVEIQAGREIMVDCNRYHYEGTFRKRTDVGWGYPSYWLDKPFGPIHTMMGCIDYPKRRAFVPVSTMLGKREFLIYNSKMPIVVYIPEEFTLRYRIWSSVGDYEYAPSE